MLQRKERVDAAAARAKPMRAPEKKPVAPPTRGRGDGPTMRVRRVLACGAAAV